MTMNMDVYYSKILGWLESKEMAKEEVTFEMLEKFIKKTLKVKYPRYVVYRLKKEGYTTQETRKIIKLVKGAKS